MRHRLLIILLVISLSACTFQVEMLTPSAQPPTLTLLPPLDQTRTPSIPDTPTSVVVQASLTSAPTSTPPAIPTFTSTALPSGEGIYPIHFAANGTFIDVVDSISAGKSRTYSINALKDQVMSISIHQSSDGEW